MSDSGHGLGAAVELQTDSVHEFGDFIFGDLAVKAFVELHEEVSATFWVPVHVHQLL